MKALLIAGATGLVGGSVLALALADDHVTQVVAPTRRPLTPHRKLLNPIVSSASFPVNADWWHVDSAICALGTTRAKAGSADAFRTIDHDYILSLAEEVRRGGARRFALTSSMNANAHSPFLYSRTKGEVEEAIRRLAFPSLTIVRPGLLGGKREEDRPLESFAEGILRLTAPILPASARINPAPVVAALLLNAALGADDGTHIITSADIARAA